MGQISHILIFFAYLWGTFTIVISGHYMIGNADVQDLNKNKTSISYKA